MDEQELAIDDLLLDQGFRNWALGIEDDEKLFWVMLKNEYPQFEKSMIKARSIVLTAEKELPIIDENTNNEMLDRLREKLGWSKGGIVKPLKSNRPFYYQIAAAVALLIVTGVALVLFTGKNEVLQSTGHLSSAMVEKSTPSGAKLNFYLEDGTHIILNAESKIRFYKSFSTDEKREIYLEGEAYFEVAKDVNRPFTVYTNQVSTTALGTAFNIDAKDVNNQVEIALAEGSVMVRNSEDNSDVVLLPGEKAVASIVDKKLSKETFDAKSSIAWKDGIIYLDKTEFEKSIQILEKWYGVEIEVKNKPQSLLTCSGEFNNDNLENVLRSLGFALKFDYNIDNKRVTIKFN